MPFCIIRAQVAGSEQAFHQTSFKSGKSVDLYEDLQAAEAAIQQLPKTDNRQVEEVKDLLAWYSLLARSGVTHVCEVSSSDGTPTPQNIHMLISNLRISGTIDSF